MARGIRPQPGIKYLFSDAACIKDKGIAAWASILIHGCETYTREGLIGSRLDCSTTAEAEGLMLALRAFTRNGYITPGDTVIALCDNQTVSQYLSGELRRKWPRKERFASALMQIKSIESSYPIALVPNWLPGHQGHETKDWRCMVQAYCDRTARYLARSAVEAISAQNGGAK